jgi:hypothetical protein
LGMMIEPMRRDQPELVAVIDNALRLRNKR